jgi:hypothetical protein
MKLSAHPTKKYELQGTRDSGEKLRAANSPENKTKEEYSTYDGRP